MLAYSAYHAGFLPTGGAMGDQHALFPEIMYWVETFLQRYGMIARGEDPDATPTTDKKSFLEDDRFFVSSSE